MGALARPGGATPTDALWTPSEEANASQILRTFAGIRF
jgi:hypothetical protein